MGRLALAHRGRVVDGLLPPMEVLEPHIERTPNHWYWLLEFFDDGLDRSAEFRWGPPDETKATFMVPRLLWQMAHVGEVPKPLLLENTCGLFTCINPAHWRDRRGALRMPSRIVLPDNVENVPVAHPNALLTVHIRQHDSSHTICGLMGNHCNVLVKKAPVTCDDCISAWVRSKHPYEEVK